MQILNVSKPSAPQLLISFSGQEAYGVTVLNNMLFVVESGGLQILDVNTPSAPQFLGSYPRGSGYAIGVAVSGSTVFLAGSALLILDVSTPRVPQLLYNYSMLILGVTVSGNLLFVEDLGGLLIFNVAIPSAPRLLGSYSVNFGLTQGVAVSGSTIFVTNGAGLLVVDMTQAVLTGVAPISTLGQQVAITVSAGTLNVTQPWVNTMFTLTSDQRPYSIQSTVTDQSVFPGHSVSLRLSSGLLFVNPGNSFLRLSIQSTGGPMLAGLTLVCLPTAVSSYPAGSGQAQILGVTVSGSTAFVSDYLNALLILDISNPGVPRLLSSYPASYTREVVIEGSLAFVANGYNGFLILNVSNLNTPVPLGNYSAGSAADARGVAVLGSTVFIGSGAGGGFQILDVSTPATPRFLGSYRSNNDEGNQGIVILGNTVFVADYSAGLEIVNVSIPSTPQLLNAYWEGTGWPAVSGGILFVGGRVGLEILNVSMPNAPRLLGTYSAGLGSIQDIAISGSTVFVADGNAGLLILDVSVPSLPVLLGSYSVGSGLAVGVDISGNTVLVAAQTDLVILDVSTWMLTISPNSSEVGNYVFQLTATDELGGSVSTQPFTIRVEGPPQVHGVIPVQYAKVGQPYHYFVPNGFFTDPNFDPIVFSANLSSGQTLPGWLSFNSISAAFAGTPFSQDVGSFNVTISATDNIAGSVNTTFQLFVDYLPVLNQPLPSQVAGVNILYQWSLPANTFFDPAGDVLTVIAQLSNGQALPAWLNFNTTTQRFSGMPSAAEEGQYYDLVVIAGDVYQGQVQAPFSLTVEYFPRLNLPIAQQLAIVGNIYTLTVPVNTFLDAQSRALTYRVAQANGLTLPNWLGFNARTVVLAGVPQLTDVGVSLLQLIATDPSGGLGQLNFNLTVTYQPVSNQPVSSQLANVNVLYQWFFSNNTFTDPLGQSLAYSVQQANGDPLPVWLRFNSALLQLFGIPNSTAVGQYSLNITAKNSAGAMASMTFSLWVEYFPQINRPVVSQWVQIDQGWTLSIPGDTFVDPENQPLVFKARQASGAALPNWLSFNPQTVIFSGVPQVTDAGKLIIQLTATDPVGGFAQQNFNLTVTQFPVPTQPIPTQLADIDQAYQWTATSELFTDPQGQALTYTAQSSSGGSLPPWLTFDSSQRRLSGQPNSTQVGGYPLAVVATNTDGAAMAAVFSLIAEYFPRLVNPILSQWANINNPFSLTITGNNFIDPEGEPLTYQTGQASGLALPNWLSFNRQTLVFSGVPQASDQGTVMIQLTATGSTRRHGAADF